MYFADVLMSDFPSLSMGMRYLATYGGIPSRIHASLMFDFDGESKAHEVLFLCRH